jgi:hypothetical protein
VRVAGRSEGIDFEKAVWTVPATAGLEENDVRRAYMYGAEFWTECVRFGPITVISFGAGNRKEEIATICNLLG